MVRKVCLNCRCGKAEHNVVEEVKTHLGFGVFIVILSHGQEGVPELPLWEGGAQCGGGGKRRHLGNWCLDSYFV